MEIFFSIILLIAIIASITTNLVMMQRFKEIEYNCLYVKKHFPLIFDEMIDDLKKVQEGISKISHQMDALPDVVRDDNHRSLLAMRDNLDNTKPIKPNNWVSFREAFNRPVRVDIHE